MGIGLGLALLLNQTLPAAKLLKRVFLLPWALSFVVNAVMWGWIYHGGYGLLNAVLVKLGILTDYHTWLANPKWALALLAFASVWKAVPFTSLLLFAALKTIPSELMDAAKVDGAGVVARFFHVTLPWIRPVMAVSLVLNLMWSLKTFDIVWVLTKGGPIDSTMLLNVFCYQAGWRFFKLDYAAAASWIIVLLTFGLTLIYFSLIESEN